jgi:CheY-like chemotaxis protein
LPKGLPEGAYALVAVSDTGPGISAEAQRTLFDRFGQGTRDILTEKPPGTGLGLAISREIISHHAGHIWVDSKPGQGSTFAFVVPVTSRLAEDVAGDVLLQSGAAAALVIDGDAAARDLVQHALANGGYHCVYATDTVSALDAAREHELALIVVDISGPDDAGLDAASVLKADEMTRDLPMVVLYAQADRETATRLEANARLVKPIDHRVLLDTLRRLSAGRADK